MNDKISIELFCSDQNISTETSTTNNRSTHQTRENVHSAEIVFSNKIEIDLFHFQTKIHLLFILNFFEIVHHTSIPSAISEYAFSGSLCSRPEIVILFQQKISIMQ